MDSRLWRGRHYPKREQIEAIIRWYATDDAWAGGDSGPVTPGLMHELGSRGLDAEVQAPGRRAVRRRRTARVNLSLRSRGALNNSINIISRDYICTP